MVYHFKVHSEDNGYWAECLELEGCSTEGDTMEELRQNAEEALNLYLEEPEDSTAIPPLPQSHTGAEIMEVTVDPELALSVLLRGLRAEHNYTQRDVAEKLGMKNVAVLNNYVKALKDKGIIYKDRYNNYKYIDVVSPKSKLEGIEFTFTAE